MLSFVAAYSTRRCGVDSRVVSGSSGEARFGRAMQGVYWVTPVWVLLVGAIFASLAADWGPPLWLHLSWSLGTDD